MNVVYSYINRNAFLVEDVEIGKYTQDSNDRRKRCYCVLYTPCDSRGVDMRLLDPSKIRELLKMHKFCSEFFQIVFQPFATNNVEAIMDLDSYCSQTSPHTPAAVVSAAFSLIPLTCALEIRVDTFSDRCKCQLLLDFPISPFSDEKKKHSDQFSFRNLFLCVLYAVAFDSAACTSDSCFCLSHYLSPSCSNCAKEKLSHSVTFWNEEFLWRLTNSILSTLALFHAAGFHFNGEITTDDIVCFTVPKELSSKLEKTLTHFQQVYDQWNLDSIKHFIHTLNRDIILPSASIRAQTPVHRTFFVLTCIPSGMLSDHTNLLSTAKESCCQKDLNSVAKILTTIIDIQKRSKEAKDSLISSELCFLIEQMCRSFVYKEPKPSLSAVSYLTRLQALQLRAKSWIYCLFAEEMHLFVRHRYKPSKTQNQPSSEKEKYEAHENIKFDNEEDSAKGKMKQFPTYELEIDEKARALDVRENELSIREKKLEVILALYELTYAHLDKLCPVESAAYSELQRQLRAESVEKALHKSESLNHHPSSILVPSCSSELSFAIKREDGDVQKGAALDVAREPTPASNHQGYSELAKSTAIAKSLHPIASEIALTLNTNSVQSISSMPWNNFNYGAPTEGLAVAIGTEATLSDPNSHNAFSSQPTLFHSTIANNTSHSFNDAERRDVKLSSLSSCCDITPQLLLSNTKPSARPHTKNETLDAQNSSLFFAPKVVPSTCHTPEESIDVHPSKVEDNILYDSPRQPAQRSDALLPVNGHYRPTSGQTVSEDFSNTGINNVDNSSVCLKQSNDAARCETYCLSKQLLSSPPSKDQSRQNKRTAALMNPKSHSVYANDNGNHLGTTSKHADSQPTLVHTLTDTLIGTVSSAPSTHAISPEGAQAHLETPCSKANVNPDSPGENAYPESRPTPNKAEPDQTWIQMHYAELEKMQNKLRQDSGGAGRSTNVSRDVESTFQKVREARVATHPHPLLKSTSKQIKASHAHGERAGDKTALSSNFFFEPPRSKLYEEEIIPNVKSLPANIVTEESFQCVELTPNQSSASSSKEAFAREEYPHSHPEDAVQTSSLPGFVARSKCDKQVTTQRKDDRMKESSDENLRANRIALSRTTCSTPPSFSHLNSHRGGDSLNKELNGASNLTSSLSPTLFKRHAFARSTASNSTTPRKSLKRASFSLAYSELPFSGRSPNHTEVPRETKDLFLSARNRVIHEEFFQSPSSSASLQRVKHQRHSILGNVSDLPSTKQQNSKQHEESAGAPTIKGKFPQPSRSFVSQPRALTSRSRPSLQGVDIFSKSTKATCESLKNTKHQSQHNSLSDTAQNLLNRLRSSPSQATRMEDEIIRAHCQMVAEQILVPTFRCSHSVSTSSSTNGSCHVCLDKLDSHSRCCEANAPDLTNPSSPYRLMQNNLKSAATLLADDAIALYRLCRHRALPIALSHAPTGGNLSNKNNSNTSLQDAAFCVCACLMPQLPLLWAELVRRAVILRPRNPTLLFGAPVLVLVRILDIERFAARSEHLQPSHSLLHKNLKEAHESSNGPSSSTVSTRQILSLTGSRSATDTSTGNAPSVTTAGVSLPTPLAKSVCLKKIVSGTLATKLSGIEPIQVECLAACYFFTVTSPTVRKKYPQVVEVHSLQDKLYNQTALTDSSIVIANKKRGRVRESKRSTEIRSSAVDDAIIKPSISTLLPTNECSFRERKFGRQLGNEGVSKDRYFDQIDRSKPWNGNSALQRLSTASPSLGSSGVINKEGRTCPGSIGFLHSGSGPYKLQRSEEINSEANVDNEDDEDEGDAIDDENSKAQNTDYDQWSTLLGLLMQTGDSDFFDNEAPTQQELQAASPTSNIERSVLSGSLSGRLSFTHLAAQTHVAALATQRNLMEALLRNPLLYDFHTWGNLALPSYKMHCTGPFIRSRLNFKFGTTTFSCGPEALESQRTPVCGLSEMLRMSDVSSWLHPARSRTHWNPSLDRSVSKTLMTPSLMPRLVSLVTFDYLWMRLLICATWLTVYADALLPRLAHLEKNEKVCSSLLPELPSKRNSPCEAASHIQSHEASREYGGFLMNENALEGGMNRVANTSPYGLWAAKFEESTYYDQLMQTSRCIALCTKILSLVKRKYGSDSSRAPNLSGSRSSLLCPVCDEEVHDSSRVKLTWSALCEDRKSLLEHVRAYIKTMSTELSTLSSANFELDGEWYTQQENSKDFETEWPPGEPNALPEASEKSRKGRIKLGTWWRAFTEMTLHHQDNTVLLARLPHSPPTLSMQGRFSTGMSLANEATNALVAKEEENYNAKTCEWEHDTVATMCADVNGNTSDIEYYFFKALSLRIYAVVEELCAIVYFSGKDTNIDVPSVRYCRPDKCTVPITNVPSSDDNLVALASDSQPTTAKTGSSKMQDKEALWNILWERYGWLHRGNDAEKTSASKPSSRLHFKKKVNDNVVSSLPSSQSVHGESTMHRLQAYTLRELVMEVVLGRCPVAHAAPLLFPFYYDKKDSGVVCEVQELPVHYKDQQQKISELLDFVPSFLPALEEEDGVLECAQCLTLFHQRCVGPFQRDFFTGYFLCHACQLLVMHDTN